MRVHEYVPHVNHVALDDQLFNYEGLPFYTPVCGSHLYTELHP